MYAPIAWKQLPEHQTGAHDQARAGDNHHLGNPSIRAPRENSYIRQNLHKINCALKIDRLSQNLETNYGPASSGGSFFESLSLSHACATMRQTPSSFASSIISTLRLSVVSFSVIRHPATATATLPKT